jgi:hypothetical protein
MWPPPICCSRINRSSARKLRRPPVLRKGFAAVCLRQVCATARATGSWNGREEALPSCIRRSQCVFGKLLPQYLLLMSTALPKITHWMPARINAILDDWITDCALAKRVQKPRTRVDAWLHPPSFPQKRKCIGCEFLLRAARLGNGQPRGLLHLFPSIIGPRTCGKPLISPYLMGWEQCGCNPHPYLVAGNPPAAS